MWWYSVPNNIDKIDIVVISTNIYTFVSYVIVSRVLFFFGISAEFSFGEIHFWMSVHKSETKSHNVLFKCLLCITYFRSCHSLTMKIGLEPFSIMSKIKWKDTYMHTNLTIIHLKKKKLFRQQPCFPNVLTFWAYLVSFVPLMLVIPFPSVSDHTSFSRP